MIGFLESRYPFLASAQEVAAENGAGLEDLLSSPGFEEARARGEDRVLSAIEHSEVSMAPLRSDFDRVMEIMSYPYARILVSCIGDKFLTRRYALSDFLRFSTRIKSTEWKLVNTELKEGYVFLTHEKFDRLLQNALQDRIEGELPLDIPPEVASAVSERVTRLSNILTAAKAKFSPQFSGELKPETLPPCIRTLMANAQNGVNLGHSGRFALVAFLHAIGMGYDQIISVFSRSPDFDESKSSYQIRHITGELNGTDGYTPPECSTMKTNGNCYDPDDLCARETVNHPLTYYRIKCGRPRRE